MRLAAFALAAVVVLARGSRADAQCARQAACPNPCTLCRVPPASGSNPATATLATLFDQVAAGPAVYGTLGWNFGAAAQLSSGAGWCGSGGAMDHVPAHFPCVLLKALYVTESNWTQFCSSGLTVVAFDCGYGIAQVTSGMRPGDTSAFDPNRVAAEPAYNVSVGAKILRDKWEAAPCVGDNDPDILEDWFFAVWGYNGFAFKNNPNNPMYPADRVEYRTPGVASAQVRGNYPYEEVVYGYVHYPPSASHYTGAPVAYPDRTQICTSCGMPTAGITEPVGAHLSTCPSVAPRDGGAPDVVAAADASQSDVQGDGVTVDDASEEDVGADVIATGVDASTGPDQDTLVRGACGCSTPGSHPRPTGAILAGLLAAGWRRRRGRA